MDELTLFVRVMLAAMFLSSAVSKLKKWLEHVAIVKDYHIVPERWVLLFARAEVAAEIGVGAMLALGFWTPAAAIGATGLLVMYSLAVGINLVRGRREVSCGCGGVAGHHRLSWWLVLCNAVLTGMSGGLIAASGNLGELDAMLAGGAFADVYGVRAWVTALIAFAMLLFYMAALELAAVRKKMKALVPNR